MSLKNILVHVTDAKQARGRVDAALQLAMKHDAHLTGLGVYSEHEIPSYAAVELNSSVLTEIAKREEARLAAAHDIFDAAVTRAGWTGRSDWLSDRGRVVDAVSLHARYADLTVIGQHTPPGGAFGGDSFADEFVLESGRPVLVIPYIGADKPIGDHIVVAWDASREAARAVGDSMPMLEKSRKVDVMSVKPERMGDLPGADIALHLARHGIKAEAKRSVANDIDIGDVLLNYVADSGADLVVMGAYGHSRLRELILGGVTRHMLNHMTVPVMLSH
jgi:nucleotide-binding universal stress UspA family protein